MQEFREVLLNKKEELLRRIHNISKHAGITLDQDAKEASIELQNDEVLQGLDEEARHELELIDKSLDRIEKGTYSKCCSCYEDIPLARLKANPFADRCIECAAAS